MKLNKAEIPPLVSVIVLNYNGEETVEECLRSILSQDYPRYEIIVVDNASRDNSKTILKRHSDRIKLLLSPKNNGYAGGMNFGALNASEESQFLAFVTQDVILSSFWIGKMVEHASARSDVAAVSSKIYDESKKAYITELKIIYPSAYYYIPLNRKIASVNIDFPSGEAFLIRKSSFRRIGMFDDDYFAYYDDGDLGWRIRLAGMKVLHAPDAEVRHYRSSVFRRESMHYRVYLYERNRISSCMKNLDIRSLLAFLVCETFMLLFHFVNYFIGKDSGKIGKAYLHAIFNVVYNLPPTLEKRKIIQGVRHHKDKFIFHESLPKHAMGGRGLILGYAPKYKTMEKFYLSLLNVIAKIIPP